jgi:NADH-quinone oxidoreductase subunit G
LNTRLETKSGNYEIKRVMPRQNERVNETWICDKGRFVHHYVRAQDRITKPMIRKDGKLVESTWDKALTMAADMIKMASGSVYGVIGDRIANEDAFAFAKLFADSIHKQNGAHSHISLSPALPAAYADIALASGVGAAFDMTQLGRGDVIVVVNGDVEEQAPVWFLRLRQAIVDRGATLIVAHHRSTKMHRYAKRIEKYDAGKAAQWANEFVSRSADALKDARNVLFVFGDEKLSAVNARALAQTIAKIVSDLGHAGKANSGVLPLYPHANTQGVIDMIDARQSSLTPSGDVRVAWLVGVGDKADAPKSHFTIVQELFMTELAQSADVVFPALSNAEREGTFTSGDRRVQRFYRALPPLGDAKPDWWIITEIAKRLGLNWNYASASQIFAELANGVPAYAGLSYERLAQTETQWPPVGRSDLYYGGTVYDNSGGVGVRYERATAADTPTSISPIEPNMGDLAREPRRLYQEGELIRRSQVIQARIA